MRAVQTLGISEDPPVVNCNHQEASRKEQTLPRSLQDLFATINKTEEDRSCACNFAFLGFYGLFGGGAPWDGAPVSDHWWLPLCAQCACRTTTPSVTLDQTPQMRLTLAPIRALSGQTLLAIDNV